MSLNADGVLEYHTYTRTNSEESEKKTNTCSVRNKAFVLMFISSDDLCWRKNTTLMIVHQLAPKRSKMTLENNFIQDLSFDNTNIYVRASS